MKKGGRFPAHGEARLQRKSRDTYVRRGDARCWEEEQVLQSPWEREGLGSGEGGVCNREPISSKRGLIPAVVSLCNSKRQPM